MSFVAREDTSPEKSMRSSSESGSTQAKKLTIIVLRIQGFDDITSANPLIVENKFSNSLPPAIKRVT